MIFEKNRVRSVVIKADWTVAERGKERFWFFLEAIVDDKEGIGRVCLSNLEDLLLLFAYEVGRVEVEDSSLNGGDNDMYFEGMCIDESDY